MPQENHSSFSSIPGIEVRKSIFRFFATILLAMGCMTFSAVGIVYILLADGNDAAFVKPKVGWIVFAIPPFVLLNIAFIRYKAKHLRKRLVICEDCLQEIDGEIVISHIPYGNVQEVSLKQVDNMWEDTIIGIDLQDVDDPKTLVTHVRNDAFDFDFYIGGGYSLSLKKIHEHIESALESYRFHSH